MDLSPWDLHLLELLVVSESPCHNLSAFISKASLQECSDFVNGQLQHFSLHLPLNDSFSLDLSLRNFGLLERAFSQGLDDVYYLLDRDDDNFFDITSKLERGCRQDNTSE